MPTKQNSIISIGDTYRLYGSSVSTHDKLPVATYVVRFNPMEGYSLSLVDDMNVGAEKVYGGRGSKVQKVLRNFSEGARNLGVMLSGDKGQGKSLFLRMIAQAGLEAGYPVIRVTENAPGIADFLDSLDECVVIFDEFEKIFSNDDEEGRNQQNQFLSLFDGTSSAKRLYCITVNELHQVSSYLVNRPGRFHYHMRFDYPDIGQVREYLTDEAHGADPTQIEKAVAFSQKINLNYDHLRAIAYELRSNPEESFESIIEDLNIKAIESSTYSIVVTFEDGVVIRSKASLNLFSGSEETSVIVRSGDRNAYLSFNPDNILEDASGAMKIHGEHVQNHHADEDDPEVSHVVMRLIGQSSYSYSSAV